MSLDYSGSQPLLLEPQVLREHSLSAPRKKTNLGLLFIQPWWLGGRADDNVHTSLCSTLVDQIPLGTKHGKVYTAVNIEYHCVSSIP